MRKNRRDLNTGLPQNIYNPMERPPAQAFENARAMMLDTAELKLSEPVSKREPLGICFYLKAQGRKRGYVESRQIDVEGPLTLEQAVMAAHEKRKARAMTPAYDPQLSDAQGRVGTIEVLCEGTAPEGQA